MVPGSKHRIAPSADNGRNGSYRFEQVRAEFARAQDLVRGKHWLHLTIWLSLDGSKQREAQSGPTTQPARTSEANDQYLMTP
jgi:hypothetical protein